MGAVTETDGRSGGPGRPRAERIAPLLSAWGMPWRPGEGPLPSCRLPNLPPATGAAPTAPPLGSRVPAHRGARVAAGSDRGGGPRSSSRGRAGRHRSRTRRTASVGRRRTGGVGLDFHLDRLYVGVTPRTVQITRVGRGDLEGPVGHHEHRGHKGGECCCHRCPRETRDALPSGGLIPPVEPGPARGQVRAGRSGRIGLRPHREET